MRRTPPLSLSLTGSGGSHELRAGHHQVGLVVQILVSGRFHQDDHGVVVVAAADQPHGAGATEDGESLAGLVLFTAESLAGGQLGGM